MKLIILLGLLNLLYVNGQLSEEFVQEQWQTFREKFNRNYESAVEEDFRYKIFTDNLIAIDRHNQKYSQGLESYFLGVTKFTDKLHTEYLKMLSCGRPALKDFDLEDDNITQLLNDDDDFDEEDEDEVDMVNVPKEIDWVKKGAVTNIKDQGDVCGSCYAFASVAALESSYFKRHGKLVDLSPQNIVDCSQKYGNEGCDGGWSFVSYNYMKAFGVNTMKSYPYKEKVGKCKFNPKSFTVKVTKYKKLKRGSESALKKFLAQNGPVAVDVDAGPNTFKEYKGGVYRDPSCTKETNHAVVVVGYGTKNGEDYWKIKNSWGEEWGINGYGLISRNRNNQCGIALDPVYPYAK